MKSYKLYLKDKDTPAVVVSSYSVETYFAMSTEQAEREHVKRCIYPELPDNHHVYSAMHDLPKDLYVNKERSGLLTIWKIKKDNIEEIAKLLRLDQNEYPYMEAMNMIEGSYFWIHAWDD